MGVFVLGLVAAAAFARVAGAWGGKETRPVFPWVDLCVQPQNKAQAQAQAQDKNPAKDHCFRVELATSPDQHKYGLMFKKDLPENEGMLFLFTPPARTSFWMKNTFVSLDMLFVDENWCVSRMAVNTTPQSLQPHDSQEPVRAVLELGAGVAARRGIGVGACLRGLDVEGMEAPSSGFVFDKTGT